MPGDRSKVVEIYAAYLEDVNQLRATRTAIDNTFVTVVTLLLAGAGYVTGTFLLPPQVLALGSWRPENLVACAGAVAISYIGIRFCKLWHQISEDNRKSIAFKFKNLEKMERDYNELKNAGARLFVKEYEDRHPEASVQLQPAAESSSQPVASRQSKVNGKTGRSASNAGNVRESSRGVSRGVRNLQKLFEEIFRILLWGVILAKVIAIIGIDFVVPALQGLSLPHW